MIRWENLSKKYGEEEVLNELTAALPEGETTVLMAASGFGKTTLAHLLLGLLAPDGGTIKGLEGKRISAVFQEDRLCEPFSALENVRLVTAKRADTDQILQELEALDLPEDMVRKPVNQLSGGQRRRVALARAMAAESDFICLDEPFKGLDVETKQKAMEYVKERGKGKTILLITHDMEEAEFFGGIGLSL